MANRFDVSRAAKHLASLLAFAMALTSGMAESRTYAGAPFGGRVIDAETGEPIAGVIVLAQWIVEGPAEAHPVAAMQILETVTDQAGRYSFPGWGPKSVPRPDFWSWIFTPTLSTRDPQLFFMKSGYAHVYEQNDLVAGKGFDTETPLRRSQLEGKDIRLKSLRGDADARRQDLYHLLVVPFGLTQGDCTWLQMPLTIQYLYSERAALTPLGEKPDSAEMVNIQRCGRPAWLKG